MASPLTAGLSKPPIGRLADLTNPINRGLIGWWLANQQGSLLPDISLKQNTATFVGTQAWTGSHHGGVAANLDGSTAYLTANPYTGLTQYSFCFWCMPNAAPGSASVMALFANSASTDSFGFSYDHNNASFRQAIFHQDSGGSYVAAKITPTLAANTWYFISGSWDGSTVRVYLNGAQNGTTGASSSLKAPVGALVFGFNPIASNQIKFNGRLDNMRVFDRALSDAEWERLYAEPYAGILGDEPEDFIAVTSITGTAAITLGAVTLAATGTSPITGAAAITLGAVTLAATGLVPVFANLSATLGALTLAVTGTIPILGNASITLGDVTLLAAGTIPILGALTVTLGALTLNSRVNEVVNVISARTVQTILSIGRLMGR